MKLRLYIIIVGTVLITSGAVYVQGRANEAVIRAIAEEEIPMSVSWQHRNESGGIMTITVTKEPDESLEDFEARIQWAEARWPPNVEE